MIINILCTVNIALLLLLFWWNRRLDKDNKLMANLLMAELGMSVERVETIDHATDEIRALHFALDHVIKERDSAYAHLEMVLNHDLNKSVEVSKIVMTFHNPPSAADFPTIFTD